MKLCMVTSSFDFSSSLRETRITMRISRVPINRIRTMVSSLGASLFRPSNRNRHRLGVSIPTISLTAS